MIAVSSCLAGINCTYAGKNNLQEKIKELVDQGEAIVVCPEVLGGLPIPRTPCEIIGNQVIDQNGIDRTYEYQLGAKKALDICLKHHVTTVILKSKSPSCGKDQIYDGTFCHKLVNGQGIFVKLLQEKGIMVYNENDIDTFLKEREKR
ncbi:MULTISPECIES: DUF523 domain-containing protein [Coprobacillaceae]|uniref:DUF523 domain-containing protein n=1 Tax=Coprobacillaceae TaxID=2810280 RepID=UPI000E480457|nr:MULTISPECIES: DUF523 domain-containing protein [Coprobacillaceae]RHS95006.1 DUF523 domain-containing protein [Erysipelatoclostridium sp. AM42-17]